MLVWFFTIGALGLSEVLREPGVVRALLPTYALGTLFGHGPHGFLLLGSIILAVTGAEALYADMGHFGRRPIRISWMSHRDAGARAGLPGPGGEGDHHPAARANPLYALAPNHAGVVVLLVLATLATIIASQALITGVFSLTRQATQLGYFPRVTIKHTSGHAEGQIYLPALNYMLMVACIALVLLFRSSERLASAYGVAVSGTMTITSIAFYMRRHPHVGLEPGQGGRAHGGVPPRGPVVPHSDPAEVLRGRLRPGGHRPGRRQRHVRLALRPQPGGQPCRHQHPEVARGARHAERRGDHADPGHRLSTSRPTRSTCRRA